MKHPRTEPRPGSRADVASDLPATKARNPPCKHTGTERGCRQGEQTKGAGALHHIKHNHTQARIRRHTQTHARERNTAGLLHSRLLHIHGAFGAFIRRDGCVHIGHVDVSRNRQNTDSDLHKAHMQTASKAWHSMRMNDTAGGNHCFVQERSRSRSRNRRTRRSDLH